MEHKRRTIEPTDDATKDSNNKPLTPEEIVKRTSGIFAAYAGNSPLEIDRDAIWCEMAIERDNRSKGIYVDDEDDESALRSDPARGSLAKYAQTRNPDASEERAWVARHIAETADNNRKGE